MQDNKNEAANTETAKSRPRKKLEDREFDIDKRVNVKNLAGWPVGFGLLHDIAGGAISFMQGSSQRMTRNEILAQVSNDNKLFTGTDGYGSHATLYIEDDETRRYVGYETDEKKQLVFTDDVVDMLFKMSQREFEEKLPYYIKTRAEKYAFTEAIKRLGYNDYSKIVFATKYTGYKI